MKRRLLLALVLAVTVASAGAASAATFGTFLAASSATGATAAVDAGGAGYVAVHVWRADNAAASTSVVYLQGSIDGVKYVRLYTFTNVTGMHATYGHGGEAASVPSWPYMRLYVADATAGRLSAKWFKR